MYQNEFYTIRKQASHKSQAGFIGLTNMRVLWCSEASSRPEVNVDICDIKKTDIAQTEKSTYLQI
jgi:hypothetical protein